MAIGSVMKAMIRHPGQMLAVFSRRNISVFFAMSRESGVGVAFSNMMRVLSNSASDIDRMNVLMGLEIRDFSGERVEVPCSENPEVSIVIPVYNQFEYTYWCVRSIVETVKDIDYEIIIADDCSTDTTTSIAEYLPGIKVVRTPRNLRFTLNCNNAAKYAKGKYLVFLNNDTIVKGGWLSSLADTMESDSSIGLVGSKMVYPDGVLQEAGGIIWRDGSAWAYGKGMNPNLPEFNYVKDVDYISGASLMIRTDVWKELQGFDERYAPSYCEDSDLAFEVRAEGYRTVFQPRSEIVHFEGISNGKAVSTNLKSYQIVNTRKFYDKWNDVLESSNPHGKDLFTARDRSGRKKHVVFVDIHTTPVDGDEHERRKSSVILGAARTGMSVHLIPDDFLYSEEYAHTYQDAGVEVLYGGEARRDMGRWAKNHRECVDTLVICEPALEGRYSRIFKGVRILNVDEFATELAL